MALKYQIALTSVWWNDDYKDVRRFSSTSDQANYFNLDTIFTNAPLVNFDIKDLMRPRIVFKESNKDVFEVLNSNYLIVKDNHDSSVQKYFFYFIDMIRQDVADQYIADCKLDVWQTFHLGVDFGSGLIERVHLSRFERVVGTTNATFKFASYKYNAVRTPLLISELPGDTYQKLLQAEYELLPDFTDTVKEWFKDNIKCWAYVFLDNSAARKFYSYYKTSQGDDPAGEKDITTPNTKYLEETYSVNGLEERYTILFFPIYKSNDSKSLELIFKLGTIGTQESVSNIISPYSFQTFLEKNNGYAYIHNIILSPVNPFSAYINNSNITFNIDSGGNLEISGNAFPGSWEADPPYALEVSPGVIYALPMTSGYGFGVLQGTQSLAKTTLTSETTSASASINYFDRMTFPIQQLKGSRNLQYEPKLRQTAYTSFKIDIGHIIEREYSFISVDQDSDFLITASFSPAHNEIKILPETLRIEDQNNDFAIQTSIDLSIPMINTQLEEYIAQNKTWARIGNITSASEKSSEWGLWTDAKGVLSVLNMGSVVNPAGFVSKAVSNMIEGDFVRNKPGDLKAAPSNIKSSVAEAFRVASEDQLHIYQRFFQVPYTILQRDADFFYWFGYKYGYYDRLDNFIGANQSRKYFNFIQGRFETISGDINDAARREITNLIAAGVRIWEVDRTDFDSTLENYEIWMDNVS